MAKIPDEKIEEVRSSANIVHYINQYVNLKKAGRNFKGLCPFHTEKTPSFIVSPEKQIYHCFGCGKGGNIFSFIMEYEKLTFLEAVTKAADFSGISLPKQSSEDQAKSDFFQQLYEINEHSSRFFEEQLHKPVHKQFLDYFTDRGLSNDTIKRFRLGYAPDAFDRLIAQLRSKQVNLEYADQLGLIQARDKGSGFYDRFRHRIMFPFHNTSGKIVGFGGRKLREEQQPKYLNSPESPVYKKGEILYGLHQAIPAIREKDYVILVEGYFDLLRLVEADFKNVVASSGTALTDRQARLINRYTRDVYIAYDGDDAGIRAAIRVAQILEEQDLNTFILKIPAGEDPDSIVQKQGAAALEAIIRKRVSLMMHRIDVFMKENNPPTLEAKERFIRDVLNDLAGLKNQLKVGLMLHQIADRLDVSETLLIQQFNQLKRRQRKPGSAAKDKNQAISAVTIHSGAYKAEGAILGLLLGKDETIKRFITDHITADLFQNPELRTLYTIIINEIEETGRIDVNSLMEDQEENKSLYGLISELAFQEQPESIKFARDCVYQIKKRYLEKKSREISTFIKAESDSIESIMHYTKELTQIRKEIAELDNHLHNLPEKEV